ncbi:DUF1330 domain-containing protein [Ferrovibrio sp.]|uniref:DUF1330 domain-containing protein n=1 Tax=Ferrovibrio sp. TaxID=1917215 RepID=UPI003512D9FA
MSKAYWIVRVSVQDAARYPEYLAAAKPAFEKYGARFLVRGGASAVLEGRGRDRNVVVEFADRTTAQACYDSPEYSAAKTIRQAAAETDFVIPEGVDSGVDNANPAGGGPKPWPDPAFRPVFSRYY